MDKHVTVSVIIPVYNVEENLRECLEVVCNQTLNDYEVICVDDCSTDHSYQYLLEYKKQYPCLKVFKQAENMGAGLARNAGMEHATGEYIAFMDADDYYHHKDTLLHLYKTAKEQQADICGGGMRYTENSEKLKANMELYSFRSDGWIEFKDYQQFFYYQRFLYRRQLLVDHGISFPNYMRFQDPPFFIKAMLAAERFYAMAEPVYVYRNESSHISWNDRKVNDFIKGNIEVLKLSFTHKLNEILYMLLKRNLEDEFLHRIFEKSLIEGNDNIVDFFKLIVENYENVIFEDKPKLDFTYGETLAKWNKQRNMTYRHRSIELADPKVERQPAVSVVLPVYNTDEYVSKTIECLLMQTLTDLEIIGIDDGSTDNSGTILDTYERKYSQIRVYHQRNQGLSAARNEGLRHAHGKYVYFMDSDDLLDAEALENLYIRAEKDQLDVLYFGAESFFDEKMSEIEKENCHLPEKYERSGQYPDVVNGQRMLVLLEQNHAFQPPVWIQFYRLDFIRKNEIAFYEGLLHEDNLFTFQTIFHAKRTGCMNVAYFHRRIRADSIMTSAVTHRNVLGIYLTALEIVRIFHQWPMQEIEQRVLYQKLNGMILNNISYRYLQISAAEKALFQASLTAEDRMQFNTFVMPTIELRSQLIASRKNKNTKVSPKVFEDRKQLLEEIQALRTSWAFRIGSKLTWLPHQLKNLIRSIRSGR